MTATARARLCAQAERYKFAAWEAAAKAVINSMLAAGVLLGPGGEPIRPGVAAQASDVIALQAGYRDITAITGAWAPSIQFQLAAKTVN